MKKIHTPISSSIGNQLTSTPRMEGTSSSGGRAVILTPFLLSRSTRLGSSGA